MDSSSPGKPVDEQSEEEWRAAYRESYGEEPTMSRAESELVIELAQEVYGGRSTRGLTIARYGFHRHVADAEYDETFADVDRGALAALLQERGLTLRDELREAVLGWVRGWTRDPM